MKGRGIAGLVAVGLAAVGLIPAAGVPAAASPQQRLAPPNLNTTAATNSYLRSLGLDPSDVLIQRGKRNYAGPRCPGKAWNCTRVTRALLQVGAQNQFECGPTGVVSEDDDPASQTCVVVQAGTNNVARCRQRTTEDTATQTCDITQTSSGGRNRAHVDQDAQPAGSDITQSTSVKQTTSGKGTNDAFIDQKILDKAQESGSVVTQSQSGEQLVYVKQLAAAGDNSATVHQKLHQIAHAQGSADVTHSQLGYQAIVEDTAPSSTTPGVQPTATGAPGIDQDSTTGSNTARFDQSQNLSVHGSDPADITQNQNVLAAPNVCESVSFTAPTHPNTCANVDQDSTGGKHAIHGKQRHDFDGHASSDAGPVDQTQGNFAGGLEIFFDQTSTAPADANLDIDERQALHAKAPDGTVTQSQTGPLGCCTGDSQTTNPDNRLTANLNSSLNASEETGTAFQNSFVDLFFFTSGHGMGMLSARDNEDRAVASCDVQAGVCSEFASCTTGDSCVSSDELSEDFAFLARNRGR